MSLMCLACLVVWSVVGIGALKRFSTPSPICSRAMLLSMSSTSGPADAWELSLRSPCKLNLFLRILGRRESGFHDLASLFQAISLSDNMYFTKLGESKGKVDELTCSDTTLEIDDGNLVIKALNLMREKTGIEAYFKVHLEKNVPMQAGLGGGSGNAATAMFAFNALCGYPANNDEMKLWSGDIGSDITFFFSSGTAYCTGRGEIVQPLPPLPGWQNARVHVFKPDEGLSTGMVFKNLDLKACEAQTDPEKLLRMWTNTSPTEAAVRGGLVNDLEPPAFLCSASLEKLKGDIAACEVFRDAVMMSGSGTSIYAITEKTMTDAAADAMTKKAVETLLTKHAGVRYFDCEFVAKEDNAKTWYR